MFADDPPDLLLLETLTLIREPQTFEMVELLLETGLPVWLSYRRCRHGVCGVYGQHWGPPEGDLFGRAARRFEEMGVEALLINCLPVDHVPGIVSWLRDFTELPLGVYPNLGHLAGKRWRFDDDDRARGLRRARARVARGGRADHRRLLRRDVRPHRRAAARRSPGRSPAAGGRPLEDRLRSAETPRRARCPSRGSTSDGTDLFPLPLPAPRARSGRVRADAGQLPRLEAPLPHGRRRGHALPRRRLRLRHPDRAARAQRRRRTCTRSTSTQQPSRTRVSNAYRNGVGERMTRRRRSISTVGDRASATT